MTDVSELSERESEILRLVATGASNKEIAQTLIISANTVKVHLRNIFGKIGVTSRTEATLYAIRIGLVQHPADDSNDLVPPELPEISAPSPAPTSWTQRLFPQNTKAWTWGTVGLVILILGGILFAYRSLLFPKGNAAPSPIVQANVTPATRWQALPKMPMPLSHMAVADYENAVYLIGGETLNAEVVGAVLRYSPDKRTWEMLKSKPTPVTDAGAITLDEEIYVPGGKTTSGQLTNRLEVYNPRNNSWKQLAALPVPISAYAIAAFEGHLYIFGGWDGSQVLATVFEYDPSLDQWQGRTPMPTARSFAGAAATTSKIYVVGGTNSQGILNKNEVYVPARDGKGENPWSTATPLPVGRAAMGITDLVDMIYLAGGSSPTDPKLDMGMYFTPLNNTWSSLEVPPSPIGPGAGLVALNNYLYIFGGTASGKPTTDSLAYHAIYTVEMPVVH